jgi:anti-sigma regulatory factor (Ser/Thr protein kinase)
MAESNHVSRWHTSRAFPGEPVSVGVARHFCTDQFVASAIEGDLTGLDAVELIASELVTNAVVAGAKTVRVELFRDTASFRLEVHDDAPGVPELREAALDDEHGRGLALVASYSATFGVDGGPGAKCVWAEVATV